MKLHRTFFPNKSVGPAENNEKKIYSFILLVINDKISDIVMNLLAYRVEVYEADQQQFNEKDSNFCSIYAALVYLNLTVYRKR